MPQNPDLHRSDILKRLLAEARDATAAQNAFKSRSWLDRMPFGYFSALALGCVSITLFVMRSLI